MLNHILPTFKKDNSLQKVNVCILTDGEACTSSYGAEYDRGEGEVVIRARRLDLGVAYVTAQLDVHTNSSHTAILPTFSLSNYVIVTLM